MPDLSGTALPVSERRGQIVAAVREKGALVLSAPPGSGKSTRVPQMLLDIAGGGRILVLQPRRIAARSLAGRVAREMGEPLGRLVGYQVRFESNLGETTRILFQTYGVRFRQALNRPRLDDAEVIVFDEFHERTLEADALLAWARRLRRGARPDLGIVVMSATLERGPLEAFLGADALEVPARVHPVAVEHQAPRLNETVDAQVLRALKRLAAGGLDGSILVFLPGQGEIRRAAETIDPFCRAQGLEVHQLHGGLTMERQQAAIEAPARAPCVILSTNVAETSLTLPGITAVIDSGLARTAAYDPGRDLNTLYLGRISRQSAEQRAGRAGRTAPGRCIRLWSAESEAAMAQALDPEIRRLDLSSLLLSLKAWDEAFSGPGGRPSAGSPGFWLSEPPRELVDRARAVLRETGAVDAAGKLTAAGRRLARFPAHPRLARALLDSGDSGSGGPAAAMAAVLEAGRPPGRGEGLDLFAAGWDLWRDPGYGGHTREVRAAYAQFDGLLRSQSGEKPPQESGTLPADREALREQATKCWLLPYQDRLAARLGGTNTFQLADGRKGAAPPGALSPSVRALIALVLHETAGRNQSRQVSIPVFLPCEVSWVEESFPGECVRESVARWDASRGRLVREERLVFRGLVLDRRESAQPAADAGEALAEKLVSGEILLPGFDEEARQWLYRIRLAARVWPESGLPAMDREDWTLLYHEICQGRQSLKELEGISMTRVLQEYIGPAQAAFLEAEAPMRRKLPSGRTGRITYFEKEPPELSARLGDFIGLEGRSYLLSGRVELVYNILAPNYRTVQKTADLTGFWKNTYPEVKKELKRRYPRHPWP